MAEDITRRQRAKEGARLGFHKGWSAFWWMMRILFPISFFTALLEGMGVFSQIDFALRPVMKWMGLPSAAALPLLIGILTNIYGGIASMVVLPLTPEQMTLIAIFLLMAHNMIQEGAVQANSGIHPLKATLFRLTTALGTTMVCAWILGSSSEPLHESAIATQSLVSFSAQMIAWLRTSAYLALKIFAIIMVIMTLLETLKALEWIGPIVEIFAPALVLLGVSRRVGILWLTAVVFGLSYGGAVIVEEAKNGDLSSEELEMLHLSIGINHSMIEDPLLFMALGLSAFWLYVPRLIVAILAVHAMKLWYRYRPT